MNYANILLNNGSMFIKDYMPALSDGRATWQRTWETEVGTVVQNDRETVTKNYVVDYLSLANRDIMVYEEGSFIQRHVYGADGKRLSTELAYAEGTRRGEAGENIASDTAAALNKVWYRTSHLDSTLFAVDTSGKVIVHTIYDAWGNPITDTSTDLNYTGLDTRNNYTGYTWDVTLELYFAQARFYDAENHRFTQEDPVKDGGNWYTYVNDNPLNFIDPQGLVPYEYMMELARYHLNGAGMSSEAIALATIPATGGNPFLLLHQLTQIFTASYMMNTGWTFVDLEYYFTEHGAVAGTMRGDIVGMKNYVQYVFEVKPMWMAYAASGSRTATLVANQIYNYYQFLNCILNNKEIKDYKVWDQKTEPNLYGTMVKRLLTTNEFDLFLRMRYVGNGIIGYEPLFSNKLGQLQSYSVTTKQAIKDYQNGLSQQLVWDPTLIGQGQVAWERLDVSGNSASSTTVLGDIHKYKNSALVNLETQMKNDFYKNGITALAVIYVTSGALLVGAVAADAGAVTVVLASSCS